MPRDTHETSQRHRDAVEMFYTMLRYGARRGLSATEARHEAYDAVELRYFITRKTLQNIMSHNADIVKGRSVSFREDNNDLVRYLQESNEQMLRTVERNCLLIETLKSIQQ